jgi:nucleotide-binding universal stress UspA family protein
MLQSIMFPTDGSALSEHALPFTQTIATAQGAEVVAVRVVEPMPWYGDQEPGYVSSENYDALIEGIESQARDELEAITSRLRHAGLQTRSELLRAALASPFWTSRSVSSRIW